MPSVFHCSPTNSTTFTTCCECAICDDQSLCPMCGVEIEPKGGHARFSAAHRRPHGNWYPNHRFNAEVIAGLRRRGYGDEADRRMAIISRSIAVS